MKHSKIAKAFLAGCISLVCSILTGQTIEIKGKLIDAEINSAIPNGVVIISPPKTISTSNQNGEFYFKCKTGRKEISTQVLGYKQAKVSFIAQSDTTLNIYLDVSTFEIGEVKVISDSIKSIEISDHGSYILNTASLYESPKHFSEPDLLKSLLILPGVVAGKDGSADIYVRGGNSGQNVVLSNGSYFFIPSHLLGIVSPFDLDFIERSELIKDYFPSDLGGGASSVIRLDYKKQKSDSLRAQLRLGILASGLTFEVPFKKMNMGLTGGIRRGNYSLYAPLLKKIIDKNVGDFLPPNNYSFNDVFFHLTHSSLKFGSISYLLLWNTDNGREEHEVSTTSSDTLMVTTSGITSGWKSMVHSLQWQPHTKGPIQWKYDLSANRLFINRYNSIELEKYLNNVDLIESRKTSFSFAPIVLNVSTALSFANDNVTHRYAGGVYYRLRFFSPNIRAINSTNDTQISNDFSEHYSISEVATFFSYNFLLLKKISVNSGLRLSGGFAQDSDYFILEPRLRLAFNQGKRFSPHLNLARISQFDHSIEASNVGLRSMLWLPVTRSFGPEISDILSFGIQGKIGKDYVWISDAFVKRTTGMVDFKSGASLIYSTTIDDLLEKIRGKAYGIETFLIKRSGKLTGNLSYTYSRSKREWVSTDGLIWIPSNSDRPHNGNVAMKYYLTDKLSFGFNWVFTSGSPATIYIHNTIYGKWYETKNNIRYPDYHRLDLSLRQTYTLKRLCISLDLDIYNVYNRKNTYYLQETYDSSRNIFTYQNVSLFPIMPTFTVTIKY